MKLISDNPEIYNNMFTKKQVISMFNSAQLFCYIKK